MVPALIQPCWVLVPGYPTPLSPWDVSGIIWSPPGLFPFTIPSIHTHRPGEMGAIPATVEHWPGHHQTLRAPWRGFLGQGGGRAGISNGIGAARAVLGPRGDPLGKPEFSKGQRSQLVDPTISCRGFQGEDEGREGILDGMAAVRAVLEPQGDPWTQAEFSKGQRPQLGDPKIPTLARRQEELV